MRAWCSICRLLTPEVSGNCQIQDSDPLSDLIALVIDFQHAGCNRLAFSERYRRGWKADIIMIMEGQR